jgi:DNA-binding SARP family transcriptional activator
VRYHVLGPLDVRDVADHPVEVTSAKHRALLTLLLLDAGRVVSVDGLIDELWGDSPPPTATATLHTYVSQLRRLLEPARGPREAPRLLVTRAPGYALHAAPEDVDAHRFPGLVSEGARLAAAGDLHLAQEVLGEAIGSWRGEAYADLLDSERARAERSRLEQILLTAHEELASVRVRLGRADLAVAELEGLVAKHPLHERLTARLMEALWASGRQADALATYHRCARLLRDELGVAPGPELAALQEAVLRHDLPSPAAWAPSVHLVDPVDQVGPVGPVGPVDSVDQLDPVDPVAHPRGGPASHETDERPLIGRGPERELILGALSRTTRGAGSVLVIEGEAGIGKTRLAEEATSLAEAQGWRAAWARCADDAGAPALWPWSQLLEQLGLGDLRLTPGEDPDQARFALFQDVRRRLQDVSTKAPLLIVLDDLQAADVTSLQLLGLVASHLEGVRLLVVVTVRTGGEELSPPVQQCLTRLAREPRALRLQVSGLTAQAVRELLEHTLGAGYDGIAGQIHERTVGNPFFVGEFAALLRARSADDDEPTPTTLPMPPSVRDVLEGRLSALPTATVEVLRLAAVAGQEFDLPLLRAALEAEPHAILDALEPALRARVVVESEPGWDWRFSHALVRETMQAGLSRLELARLHQRIATTLEVRGHRSAMDVGRLAHHFLQSVPVAGADPAIRYATLAAAAARDRFAHPEAAELTERVLRLLDLLPGDTDRQRHALLVDLATDLLRSGEPFRAQETVESALELARRLHDHQLMAEAAAVWGGVTLWNWRAYGAVDQELVGVLESLAAESLDNAPLQARLLGTLGCELAYSDRRDEGIRYAERAVELARTLGDPVLLGTTLNNVSIAAWGADDGVERRIAAADEALALAGRGLPARTEFFALLHRGPLRLHGGDARGFEEDLRAATRVAATLAGPEVRPHVIYQEAGRAMLHGEWERAEELAREAYDLYLSASMWGAAEMCWALHQFTFRRREARPGEAVDVLVGVGDDGVPLAQVCAVVAAAESGDVDLAHRLEARWPEQHPLDWTRDALVVVRAWRALALGGDVRAAYSSVLPFRGRQIVVGTATACWGSYDLVLSDLAASMGEGTAAIAHARDAVTCGRTVGSPWQVADAEARLAALIGRADTEITASA